MIKKGKLDFRMKQNQSKYAVFSTLTSVIWGNLDSNDPEHIRKSFTPPMPWRTSIDSHGK
jgi:hypothetical protein